MLCFGFFFSFFFLIRGGDAMKSPPLDSPSSGIKKTTTKTRFVDTCEGLMQITHLYVLQARVSNRRNGRIAAKWNYLH